MEFAHDADDGADVYGMQHECRGEGVACEGGG